MTNPFTAAAAVIDRVLALDIVTYDGGGLPAPTDISVVWSDMPGDPFQGPGNTTRTISAEIRFEKLQARPTRADRLTRNGVVWKPQQIEARGDVSAWNVTLELA